MCAILPFLPPFYNMLITLSAVYLATTFPDDFEASPLNIDDLQKMDQSMGNETPVVFDKVGGDLDSLSCWQMLIDL